jgi:N-acetylglucosamine kinase-like BadF-type ATPase
VADTTGRLFSYGFGGPANRFFVSPRSAERAVLGALAKALKSRPRKLDALVVAGPHLPKHVFEALSQYASRKRTIITDEFELALAAGLKKPGGWGAVVTAGTGSFCKARNAKGAVEYSGGWGPLIGDEGSGYDIAREALSAVIRARDGRGRETVLTQAILSALELREIQDLKTLLYAPPIKRHKLAALAHLVFEAAGTGDAVATEILRGAGFRLARLAEPIISRLFENDERFPVILTGGVMREGSILVHALASEIAKFRSAADVFVSPLQPVAGALIIGLDAIGVTIDSTTISNLMEGDSRIRPLIDGRENKKK